MKKWRLKCSRCGWEVPVMACEAPQISGRKIKTITGQGLSIAILELVAAIAKP